MPTMSDSWRLKGHQFNCRKVIKVWEANNHDDSCRGGWGYKISKRKKCTCDKEEEDA
jgi:hypothetical protein